MRFCQVGNFTNWPSAALALARRLRHLSTRFPRWEREKRVKNPLETLTMIATTDPRASGMKSQTSVMTRTSKTTSRTKVRLENLLILVNVTRALFMAAPASIRLVHFACKMPSPAQILLTFKHNFRKQLQGIYVNLFVLQLIIYAELKFN